MTSGLLAVILVTDDTECAHSFGNRGYYALVPMVGYGASAIYGWRVTKKCRHARAAVAP